MTPHIINEDRLYEACGVFGVFNHKDAAALTTLGLHALQHRGQESAGIAVFDGAFFHSERRLGLVGDHFTQHEIISRLKGENAIGHVRYSTSGETLMRNTQPLFADIPGGGVACAHNGHLTNGITLRHALVREGAIFQSTSDTEIILHLMAQSRETRTVDKLVRALQQIEGAYALTILTNTQLIGVRDPLGIRPLVLGDLEGAPILASETCALDIIGAKHVREVAPGEVIIASQDGIKSLYPFPVVHHRPCIFEYIYFSRPDSIARGKSIYEWRMAMGRELARETHIEADIISPVPDSGVPAALGYASQVDLPLQLSIIRNHYVGRTFIEPTQHIRQLGVKLKHNPNRTIIDGKRIILVDDSIVRGTTSVKIVQMLFEAGAKEVHMRIASPPITHPDFYGIDTPDRNQLLAATHDLEAMKEHLKVNTLGFLSIDGLYRALGHAARNAENPQFTDHCFTGDYPTPLRDSHTPVSMQQLSLLSGHR